VKLPRDVSGAELAKRLRKLGYRVIRQTGSHIRLTRSGPREHHVTIPVHNPLRIGTLAAIVSEIAGQLELTRGEAIKKLFGD
jgi:predicted RNA binding protein YcfA (HicA-like mRNA interferase family)